MRNILKLSICGISAATALTAVSPLHAETVQEAVQHALRFNPDVLFQTARKLSTEQGARQAKGAFFPTLDLNAGIGRQKSLNPSIVVINPEGSAIDGNGIVLTRKESSLELAQNLYAGGGIMGEFERKENLYNAQVLKVFGVADDTALKVVEQYLNVLKGRQMVAYARENLSKHLRLQGMIKDRNEAGLERSAESEQARGRVALARANLIAEQANLRESKINYLRIVGEEARSLEWPQIPSAKDLPHGSGDAVNYALLNHPTLKSAYADVEQAKSQHKVSNATNYPRVDLVLNASRGEDLDGLIGVNQSTSAMVRMSYNLFRGGSDLAHQRKTAYQVQEAYEVKNRTYEEVKESMRLSWNALVTAQSRLVPLRNYRDASGKTLDAYMEEFKLAKRSLLDVLDSTNEHYQAKLNYLDGVYKEMFARYRILNSAGRLVPYLAAYSPIEIHNTDFMTSHQFFDEGGLNTAENRNMNRMEGNTPLASENVPMVHTSTTDNLMQLTELHGDSVLAAPFGLQAETQQKALAKAKSLNPSSYALRATADKSLAVATAPASAVPATAGVAPVVAPTHVAMVPASAVPATAGAAPVVAPTHVAMVPASAVPATAGAAPVVAPTHVAMVPASAVPATAVVAMAHPVAAKPATMASAASVAKPAIAQSAKAWYVQAGTFAHADHAHNLLNLLQSQGFNQAFLMKSQNLDLVYIGPYQYRGEAVAAEATIKSKMGVNPVLAYFALNQESHNA